jgi:hypothetical protein
MKQGGRSVTDKAYRHYWWPFLIIGSGLGIAIFLRFFELEARGVVLWDTAMYVGKAIQMSQEIRALFKGSSISVLNNCELKPGHLVAHGMSILFFGVSHLSVIGVQAFSGVIAVIGVCVVGWRMLGLKGCIFSTAFIATAGLPVAMSRTGWPQSITLALIGVGYLLYQQSLRKDQRNLATISGLGVVGGLASTLHLASVFFFMAVFATELIRALFFRQVKWWDLFLRLLCLCLATVTTIALIEGALRLIGSSYIGCTFSYILDSRGLDQVMRSPSLGSLLERLHDLDQLRESWTFFSVAVMPYESIIFIVSASLGLILAIAISTRSQSPLLLLMVVHIALSAVYFSWFYSTIKGIHYAYFPASLLAGLFWVRIFQWVGLYFPQFASRLSVLMASCLIVVFGAYSVWPIVAYRSGYDAAFTSLIQHINQKNKTLSMAETWMDHSIHPLVEYYMRIHESKIERNRRQNIGYFPETDLVVVDYHVYRQPDYPDSYFDALKPEGVVVRAKMLEEPLPTIHYHRPNGLARLTEDRFFHESQGKMGQYFAVYDLTKTR